MKNNLNSSIRLDPELMAIAKREGAIKKRSAPKQIEFWATLGKAVEHIIDPKDIIAVIQGFKKLKVESLMSSAVDPVEVFNSLAEDRKSGKLAENVTSSPIYFEASKTKPGLLDRVNLATGERQTGRFYNGEFVIQT